MQDFEETFRVFEDAADGDFRRFEVDAIVSGVDKRRRECPVRWFGSLAPQIIRLA